MDHARTRSAPRRLWRTADALLAFTAMWAAVLCAASSARAATITVNAGGDLQLAINSAQPCDVILLQAGATFTGNFVLPVKPGTGPAITIRSSAADSNLPAAGQRIQPSVHAIYLPKIKSPNTSPALQI